MMDARNRSGEAGRSWQADGQPSGRAHGQGVRHSRPRFPRADDVAAILFGKPRPANDNEPVRKALDRALDEAPTEVLREALAETLDRMRKERGDARKSSNANNPQANNGRQ